eukprot:5598167-Prymnesium_polylepis.1
MACSRLRSRFTSDGLSPIARAPLCRRRSARARNSPILLRSAILLTQCAVHIAWREIARSFRGSFRTRGAQRAPQAMA